MMSSSATEVPRGCLLPQRASSLVILFFATLCTGSSCVVPKWATPSKDLDVRSWTSVYTAPLMIVAAIGIFCALAALGYVVWSTLHDLQRPTCAYEGCNRPCAYDGFDWHYFCGNTHRRLWLQKVSESATIHGVNSPGSERRALVERFQNKTYENLERQCRRARAVTRVKLGVWAVVWLLLSWSAQPSECTFVDSHDLGYNVSFATHGNGVVFYAKEHSISFDGMDVAANVPTDQE